MADHETRILADAESGGVSAGLRTPEEVMALVIPPEHARRAAEHLAGGMACLPGTYVGVLDGHLTWFSEKHEASPGRA